MTNPAQVTSDGMNQFLVVGGTGMLAPLCQAAQAYQPIVAARFISNWGQVGQLPETTLRIALDYTDKQSVAAFLASFNGWHNLSCCVLWVHSHAHDFSAELIQAASQRKQPPAIIHLFGSGTDTQVLEQHAAAAQVPFLAVQLHAVDTSSGKRWMTHSEISRLAAQAINVLCPDMNLTVKAQCDNIQSS